jgi:GT2 family glycosyltransferase
MPNRLLSSLKKRTPESLLTAYRGIRARFLSVGLRRAGEFVQPEPEIRASGDMSIIMPVLDPPTLRRCLASVERYAPRAEVILVDDGSVLEETKKIIRDFTSRNGWKCVRHESPKGHSRATEAGAAIATRPYLCLLNSDTIITPWSWRAAQEAFAADPKIAITGPSTSHCSTAQMVRRAELCRYHWNDAQVFDFAGRYVAGLPPRPWVDLPDIGGFALFIRREIWEQFEGFDPHLPDYGNEVDLCMRISKNGWRLVWTKDSYIHHFGGLTYSSARFGSNFIRSRSLHAQAYIDQKHGISSAVTTK